MADLGFMRRHQWDGLYYRARTATHLRPIQRYENPGLVLWHMRRVAKHLAPKYAHQFPTVYMLLRHGYVVWRIDWVEEMDE